MRTSEVAREHASQAFDHFRLVSDRGQEILGGLDRTAIAGSEKALHDDFKPIIPNVPQIQNFIVLGRGARLQVATAVHPVDKTIFPIAIILRC